MSFKRAIISLCCGSFVCLAFCLAACSCQEGEARGQLPFVYLKEASGELDELISELQRFIDVYQGTSQEEVAKNELSYIEEILLKDLPGKEEAITTITEAVLRYNAELLEAKGAPASISLQKKARPIKVDGLKIKLEEELEDLWLLTKKAHLSFRAYYRFAGTYPNLIDFLGLKYDKERYKITPIPFNRQGDVYTAYNAEIYDRETGAYITMNYKAEVEFHYTIKGYLQHLKNRFVVTELKP